MEPCWLALGQSMKTGPRPPPTENSRSRMLLSREEEPAQIKCGKAQNKHQEQHGQVAHSIPPRGTHDNVKLPVDREWARP